MRILTTATMGILLAALLSPAWAQTNVGQLLDGGAVKLTAEEFKQEIVGRLLEGPGRGVVLGDSATQHVVYLDSGEIRGSGQASNRAGAGGGGQTFSIDGTWVVDEQQRVCQSTRAGSVVLAPRCQFWFKKSGKYYLADSDTDRSAQITVRTVRKM